MAVDGGEALILGAYLGPGFFKYSISAFFIPKPARGHYLSPFSFFAEVFPKGRWHHVRTRRLWLTRSFLLLINHHGSIQFSRLRFHQWTKVNTREYQSTNANLPFRNNFLTDKGLPLPKATSTGTTIVGCLFKDGIVLGADTRATEGPIVADKNCEKVC